MIKWLKKLFKTCDHDWIPITETEFKEIYHIEYDYFCTKCGDLK